MIPHPARFVNAFFDFYSVFSRRLSAKPDEKITSRLGSIHIASAPSMLSISARPSYGGMLNSAVDSASATPESGYNTLTAFAHAAGCRVSGSMMWW